jgi:ATP-dependent DNA ligase
MKMKKVTLYHRRASGKVKVWMCELVGLEVRSMWGQRGGEMNRTVETPRPKMGKSLEESAQAMFDRKVERKQKKGYVVDLGRVVETIAVDDTALNFNRLPKSFAPAKPFKSYDPDEMARWAKDDLLLVQRKRDGMRHHLVSDATGRVRIYSSGKDDLTEHLQPLLDGIVLSPCTILDCELVVTNSKDADEFNLVASIARSGPERAVGRIRDLRRAGYAIQLFAFDLLWESGVPIYKYRYDDRYKRLAKTIARSQASALLRMPLVGSTLSEAIAKVKKHKWEGLVVWRRDQATAVQVNGSPKRVNCWKVKPIQEEDVVAVGYELGKGKNAKVVGKFNLGLYRRGQLVEMGRCGTGLDDETREKALRWKYPCVIQIEYDQKSEKGFRFPVFIRKREDKKVNECTEV